MGDRGPTKQLEVVRGGGKVTALPGADSDSRTVEHIEPPSWLTEGAREVWDSLYPSLHAAGRVKPEYVLEFARYCEFHDQYIKAKEIVDECGFTIVSINKNGTGYEMKRPEVSIMQEAAKQCLNISRRFGFTPSDALGLGPIKTPGRPSKNTQRQQGK